MAKKKYILTTEFDHDYTLIVIKSVLDDYRLAYFLNDVFNLQFKKENFELSFHNKKGKFSIFGYEDLTNNTYWSLIANKQVIENEVKSDNYNLFDEISNTFVLLPEEKKADYFLKIENDTQEITTLIKKINTIHKVITSYEINPNDLKSKDLLIF